MTEAENPPAEDEAELSVFGPGFGECLLVHLGAGEWLMVDSCMDQRRREQPALAYLRRIGVDPASAVKLIVVTHWHDDHIRGLADAVAQCGAARFACSAAFLNREMLRLVGVMRKAPRDAMSGVREIARALEVVRRRATGPVPPIEPVGPSQALFTASRASGTVRVVSLSPASATILRAYLALASQIPSVGDAGIAAPEPNDCAIAMHVEYPGTALLLGADLEETNQPGEGWTAVLALPARPTARSSAFKIPHHGSVNGHHDGVWEEMLSPPVYAALTPYVRLATPLPTAADAARILARTPMAYITSGADRPGTQRRDNAAERQLRMVARRFREAEPFIGQVRLRRRFGNETEQTWTVALFGAARHLSNVA